MDQRATLEARSAGLRARDVSLTDVDRRRTELWATAVSVVAMVSVLASVAPTRLPWVADAAPAWTLRLSLALLASAFVAYVAEKELHLRRLQRMLLDERVLSHAYAERVRQLALLADGARAVNSILDVDEVLKRLLDRALAIVDARSGSVLLLDAPGGTLRVACVTGEYRCAGDVVDLAGLPRGASIDEHVPVFEPASPAAPSMITVPLVHRDELLGALEVQGHDGFQLTEYDMQALSVFAEYVSVGLANARLYGEERSRVAELRELDEMKSQFLSTVSHELKTPLTAIIGSASVLRNTPVNEAEQAELLESVDRQARRLADMVDQLLVAGRMQERPNAVTAPADLCALVRLVVGDFSLSGREVAVDVPDACLVDIESGPLQQILWNLLDNAHKHGGPPVCLEVAERGSVTLCSVLDGGPGVPPEAKSEVFERFYRVDSAGGVPGMGLGLGIVRQLVEAVGGRVWIDDRPGGGAAVRVALPTHGHADPGAGLDTLARGWPTAPAAP